MKSISLPTKSQNSVRKMMTNGFSLASDTCADLSAEEEEGEQDPREESPPEHASVCSCLPASLECLADTSDSCFLQFESCPTEESWLIPTPCFTAGGLTTIKVETSPMENLLIKHPSTSVYAVHASCPGLSEASCGPEELPDPTRPGPGKAANKLRMRWSSTRTAMWQLLLLIQLFWNNPRAFTLPSG